MDNRADTLRVVVGAGVIGTGVTQTLARQGHRVRVVTRSGSGPSGTGIERVAADAADAERMAGLCAGATVIYNCANPPYHRWPELWPPIATALLGAAERAGAVLVTISNLYGYGPARESIGTDGYDVAHPMAEDTPQAATGRKGRVRAAMWRDALAAHEAGRVRVVEVRASDYLGPRASSVISDRLVRRVLGGRGVRVLGRTDRLRTWTFTGDVAALAVRAGADERAFGRAWHVPSGPPRAQSEVIGDIAKAAGRSPVPVRPLPEAALRAAGVFSPLIRELAETRYQFDQDFVMDSTAAQRAFGLRPTDWDQVIEAVLRGATGS
jgi:nucleoside-diphosphate-sugar epimerase